MKLTKDVLKQLIKEELASAEQFEVGDIVEYFEPIWADGESEDPPPKYLGVVANPPENWKTDVPVYIANYGIYGFGTNQLTMRSKYKEQ